MVMLRVAYAEFHWCSVTNKLFMNYSKCRNAEGRDAIILAPRCIQVKGKAVILAIIYIFQSSEAVFLVVCDPSMNELWAT